jgi:hypothetical protein
LADSNKDKEKEVKFYMLMHRDAATTVSVPISANENIKAEN